MRYKNWKMYYTMSQPGAEGWIMPLIPFHFTLVQNIKRDPFEQAVGVDQKTAMGLAARLAAQSPPSSTTGTCCRSASSSGMKQLESYEKFPPLQAPETYNLSGILEQMKKASHASD